MSEESPTALIPRELSQLAFNARVLQEARDESVPLLERLRFLGIFSNNQDEYYRVQVATVQRTHKLAPRGAAASGDGPAAVLAEIQRRILRDQAIFLRTYDEVLAELGTHGIRIITDQDLNPEQSRFVASYFVEKVRPYLTPIMLRRGEQELNLDERDIYLAVRVLRAGGRRPIHAIVDIPTGAAPRFVRLPSAPGSTTIILLEDVIRLRLVDIFSIFRAESAHGYVVKLTRDGGLALDRTPRDSYMRKVEKSVMRRRTAALVRFVYDAAMPDELLRILCRNLRIQDQSVLVAGGRHHNFKDFIGFPKLKAALRYRPWPALGLPRIDRERSLLESMRRQDILIQTPYQNFSYLIDLLREAAIDPKVTKISVALYRIANNSGIVRALINAARNGKRVTAIVEITARFDETTNLEFTNKLNREGVRVVFGSEGLKIHAKMGLIERREQKQRALYGFVGTGNLKEVTARLYTDHFLLTTHEGICADIARLFRVIRRPYEPRDMNHLLVSPWSLGSGIHDLIRAETERARKGEAALIEAKLNNLTHPVTVRLLREAAEAGVEIRLIVRGTFSLPTDDLRPKAPFRAISILDRYLEHSRLICFGNGGDPLYFLTSADWMTRNFERRIEIACPIYDPRVQATVRRYLDLQWADDSKARKHDSRGHNERVEPGTPKRAAQQSIYQWLASETEAERDAGAATPGLGPVAVPEPEPAAVPDPEPVAEPDPEPVAEPDPEPVAEPDPEPVAVRSTPSPSPASRRA